MRPGCGNKLADFAQTMGRHTAVYGFVITGFNDVSFVPDADIAPAGSRPPVKFNPGRPMLFVFGARIRLEMLEGAPVLDNGAPKDGYAQETRIPDELRVPSAFWAWPKTRAATYAASTAG